MIFSEYRCYFLRVCWPSARSAFDVLDSGCGRLEWPRLCTHAAFEAKAFRSLSTDYYEPLRFLGMLEISFYVTLTSIEHISATEHANAT